MKPTAPVLVLLWLCAAGCGGEEFSSASGSGGGASGGAAGSAGAGASGGTAGAGGGGGSGGSGGAATGGSGGAATGGSGGAATCPGTAPGCVIDWVGQFGQPGANDGVGTAARLSNVGPITGDGKYVYVGAGDAIRRIEIATATVTTLAGQSGQPGYLDAVGTLARFSGVGGLATDGKTLWVSESGNHTIRAVDLGTATVTTLAGLAGQTGVVDGIGPAARFTGPRGLALAGGRVMVAEAGNHALRQVDTKTAQVVTLAGMNGPGVTDGAGNLAQFSAPRALGFFNNEVWVGDTENHRLRRVVPGSNATASKVTSPVGSSAGFADGVGTAAQFKRLRGVTSDGASLLVADSDNYVIRKVDPQGLGVTTIAGTGGNMAHAEGIGAAAAFNKPFDLHFDPGSGDLFITETDVVRRMYYQ